MCICLWIWTAQVNLPYRISIMMVKSHHYHIFGIHVYLTSLGFWIFLSAYNWFCEQQCGNSSSPWNLRGNLVCIFDLRWAEIKYKGISAMTSWHKPSSNIAIELKILKSATEIILFHNKLDVITQKTALISYQQSEKNDSAKQLSNMVRSCTKDISTF